MLWDLRVRPTRPSNCANRPVACDLKLALRAGDGGYMVALLLMIYTIRFVVIGPAQSGATQSQHDADHGCRIQPCRQSRDQPPQWGLTKTNTFLVARFKLHL